MENDAVYTTIDDVAGILSLDLEYALDGTLLYATLDNGYVAPCIFKDRGDHILYREPDLDVLGDALLDFWEGQEGGHRWTEMELLIRDGRFDVRYTYADAIDPEENSIDRSERIVRSYFGDKPIIYPPWDAAGWPAYTL